MRGYGGMSGMLGLAAMTLAMSGTRRVRPSPEQVKTMPAKEREEHEAEIRIREERARAWRIKTHRNKIKVTLETPHDWPRNPKETRGPLRTGQDLQ